MYSVPILYSVMAVASASKALHYTVPSSFKAAASNCTLPAEFVVTNFTTFTDKADNSLNTVCFQYNDPDTKIQTTCHHNSTSTASGPSKNRYTCDNANIAFIYQTTGIAGLTVTERACSSTASSQFEASGLITPELNCTNTSTGTLCVAKQNSIQGDFDSFQPVPPQAPTRRDQRTWRG
ncbi:hypothetical protein O1611_g6317 [Lasiodiplodia mahajangana]|uniref:Uncharacterized protein n=1 Tax=Lasiodiplodia mahajangana TaxID=1108764 RepID=A0ACC2JIW9_9PEZI|nr:hypothetical protein O1611_g6317 [Lasiodiplodia mahajangana]